MLNWPLSIFLQSYTRSLRFAKGSETMEAQKMITFSSFLSSFSLCIKHSLSLCAPRIWLLPSLNLPSSSDQRRDDNTVVGHQIFFWRVKHPMKHRIKIHHSSVLTNKEIFYSCINVLLLGKKPDFKKWHTDANLTDARWQPPSWHSCQMPVRTRPCSELLARNHKALIFFASETVD